jgi:hypothetical protein
MFTLYTQSQVASKVARIVRIAGRVEAEVHQIACSILDHTRAHGDYTQALVLLNGLPRGTRVKALAFWFKHYSSNKLIFTFAKGEWTAELKKDRKDSDFNVTEAMGTTFADLTNEKDPVSVTVESILRNLNRNATNTDMHEDGTTPKVSPEARAFASKLVLLAREAGLDPKVKAA